MRSWIDYSGEVVWDPSLSLVEQLVAAGQPFWLDIENASDEVIDQLAALLGLHPLAVEDSKQFGQRAKLQVYGNGAMLVGFGPGEVMRLMAERVGAGGRVTGLDNDGRVGREAVEVLRATVAGQFEFVQADAETTDEPAGGPFDLVYARLLLFHLPDPVTMVRKMYTWTRPGGVLLVQDWDCRTMDIVPRLATWAEFERVMYGVFDKAGRDPRIGVKLPLHFAAAGLGEPDGTDVAGQLRPLAEIGGLFQGVYQSMQPAALRFGLTTDAAGQAFIAEIAEAIRQRRGVGMSPLLVSAWKHKPPG